MRQSQLDLLRKIVDVSSSLSDKGCSYEFVVDTTTQGTDITFFWASEVIAIDKVSTSDINELHSRGLIRLTKVHRHGDKNYEVVNEAFEMFRGNEIPDHANQLKFDTGDTGLDALLDSALTKYKLAETAERKIALEKLWDAWERLKTLEPGDKKTSIATLLDTAAPAPFREVLEAEASALTDVGNEYDIRHHETDRHKISDSHHVDYLFERMLSLIRLVLRKSGRM